MLRHRWIRQADGCSRASFESPVQVVGESCIVQQRRLPWCIMRHSVVCTTLNACRTDFSHRAIRLCTMHAAQTSRTGLYVSVQCMPHRLLAPGYTS
eukprot:1182561-Prorocentrum_minimum.AAC.2